MGHIRKVMEGGTVYILQEFVSSSPLSLLSPAWKFFSVSGGRIFYCHNINLDNTWKGFKRIFFISVSHSRFALLEAFSNEFFGQYRETRASENRVILSFSVVTFAVCYSSFQLQSTVLAYLRQRVIARDQSDRCPVWPYQSRCYICLLSIGNNFNF